MTQEDINALAEDLKKIPQGYIPEPVFSEVARIAVLSAVEFIPFRKNKGAVEVLLFRRSPDDQFWPNALHTPGTVIRASDSTFEDVFNRLFDEELYSQTLPVAFIGNELTLNNRGRAILFKYIIDVTNIPTAGTFYNINSLPEDLLLEHKEMIKDAAVHFI